MEAVLSENTSLQQKIDAVLIENTAHVKHIKDLSLQKEMMECSLNEMKGNGHQMGAVNNQVEQGLFEAKAELDTAKAEKENLLKVSKTQNVSKFSLMLLIADCGFRSTFNKLRKSIPSTTIRH